MYYKMLSQKYLQDAEILRVYVKKLKTLCSDSRNDCIEINFRIATLYAMYLELKHTGEYLNRKNEVVSYGKQSAFS